MIKRRCHGLFTFMTSDRLDSAVTGSNQTSVLRLEKRIVDKLCLYSDEADDPRSLKEIWQTRRMDDEYDVRMRDRQRVMQ